MLVGHAHSNQFFGGKERWPLPQSIPAGPWLSQHKTPEWCLGWCAAARTSRMHCEMQRCGPQHFPLVPVHAVDGFIYKLGDQDSTRVTGVHSLPDSLLKVMRDQTWAQSFSMNAPAITLRGPHWQVCCSCCRRGSDSSWVLPLPCTAELAPGLQQKECYSQVAALQYRVSGPKPGTAMWPYLRAGQAPGQERFTFCLCQPSSLQLALR